jgi:hypothetical protein
MEALTNNQLFVGVVCIVIPYLLARFFAWRKEQARKDGDEAKAAGLEALEAGIHDQWVRHAKQWKKESGVLKVEQREKLRKGAVDMAKAILGTRGISPDKALGGPTTIAMRIAGIIAKRKAAKRPK